MASDRNAESELASAMVYVGDSTTGAEVECAQVGPTITNGEWTAVECTPTPYIGDYIKIVKDTESNSVLTFCGINVYGTAVYDESLSYTEAGWLDPAEDEVEPTLQTIPTMSTEPCAEDINYAKVMMSIEY